MAIVELLEVRARRLVACIGFNPTGPERATLAERDFAVEECSAEELKDQNFLAGVSAVIVRQNPDKPRRIADWLGTHARFLLNSDCRIFVQLADNPKLGRRARQFVIDSISELQLPAGGLLGDEQRRFASWLDRGQGDSLAPFVYLCDTAMNWTNIATLVSQNSTGKAPNFDVRLDVRDKEGRKVALEPDIELLLRRAFWDCAEVHLSQMLDGLSGAAVYRAYGELEGGNHGRWPFACFVKTGPRKDIFTEYANYEASARMYIPFHLGPRLDRERCSLGASHGVLVGDFVDESESLRDSASAGRAANAIAGLFNRTLRGWHADSREDDKESIGDRLLPLLPIKIPLHRAELIEKLGGKRDLSELISIISKHSSKPVLIGRIHGDLHATNVLVRANDAIVIDFLKHDRDAPVIYDPASLEAGLLVEGEFGLKSGRLQSDWLESVMPLYKSIPLYTQLSPCHPKDQSAWFFGCVRQIRLFASHMARANNQYEMALAAALLKKSCNRHKFDSAREWQRAAAYVIAERILMSIASIQSK